MIRLRLVVAAAMAAAASYAAAAQAPQQNCSAPEHRQLDFWVGEWSLTDQTTGQPAGTSRIESLHGGCVIRESYSNKGFDGGSLNIYWRGDGRWHQTWMDSAGAFRHFIGGLDASGRMVLTAQQPNPNEPGRTRLVRMAYTRNSDGTVRQYSDLSDDGGATWRLRYDYLYRRLR